MNREKLSPPKYKLSGVVSESDFTEPNEETRSVYMASVDRGRWHSGSLSYNFMWLVCGIMSLYLLSQNHPVLAMIEVSIFSVMLME